jgi:DNA-binding CsgD family transcriptional regulator
VGGLALVAYQPRKNVVAWGSAVLRAFNALFPRSAGGVARVLDLQTRRPRGGYILQGCRADVADGLLESERTSAHRVDLVAHGRGLRRLFGPTLPRALQEDSYIKQMQRRFRERRLEDMWHLTASDGESVCVSVGALLAPGAVVPGGRAVWARVSRQFDAGLRLQRRVEQLRAELAVGADEAILSPDGEVLDAHGLAATPRARGRLREIARRRTALGAPEAEEVWRGVLDGTWSVVERHAHDGRRYLVALRIHGPPGPGRLLPQEAAIASLAAEGLTDKAIAQVLGVARTTVATQLAAALRKLGVASRVDLVRVFSPGASGARGGDP